MEVKELRFIDGLCIRSFFPESLIRSTLAYSPHPDDIFVVSYPKCGTTWTQYLVLSVLTDGEPPTSLEDFMLASPYMEMMGAEAAEKMPRPGLLKTHLPFDKQPYSKQAKYIYVARNPYDVCVSYYYFLKSMTPKRVKDVSFSKFHQLFVSGSVSYGDYFDHLLSWYKHRHDNNVLFLTYEQLKKEPGFWTLKIANFLGGDYADRMREDPVLLQKVLDATMLEKMMQVFNGKIFTVIKRLLDLPPDRAIKSMEVYRSKLAHPEEMHEDYGFIRKGVVGDWRAHFSKDQIKKTKSWIARKTEGSDVMRLWKDLHLP
ncbi:sulfotransferase 1B1-like [Dermacentor andersoni]|uniref:sulfotransferase 1B1-like n=1 Tax=Dermacentor andersoni TaxID=34620 RepID=UPI0021552D46|nr:sulfotransferase 1B1-like [Dermacentor andersoni]